MNKETETVDTEVGAIPAPTYSRKRRPSSAAPGNNAADNEIEPSFFDGLIDHTPLSLIAEIGKMLRDKMGEDNATDISASCRTILLNLAFKDGRNQSELSHITHLKPPTISLGLAKLEEQGYVRRETDPDDQRQTRVFLTEKGSAINSVSYDSFNRFEERALRCLDSEEKARLKELLIKVRNHLIKNS